MRSLRILVVEDDLLIGTLLTEMLEDMGYKVCSVETTETAAVNAALLAKPDLMIVDVHLGYGSGVAAVDAISRTLSIPHIFVSGDRLLARRESAITLQKPFNRRQLLQAINRAINAETVIL